MTQKRPAPIYQVRAVSALVWVQSAIRPHKSRPGPNRLSRRRGGDSSTSVRFWTDADESCTVLLLTPVVSAICRVDMSRRSQPDSWIVLVLVSVGRVSCRLDPVGRGREVRREPRVPGPRSGTRSGRSRNDVRRAAAVRRLAGWRGCGLPRSTWSRRAPGRSNGNGPPQLTGAGPLGAALGAQGATSLLCQLVEVLGLNRNFVLGAQGATSLLCQLVEVLGLNRNFVLGAQGATSLLCQNIGGW
jgi:hypothetical protein